MKSKRVLCDSKTLNYNITVLFYKFFVSFAVSAFQNSVECLQILLEHKSDMNARDIRKRTPLMMAAYKGHDQIVGKNCFGLDSSLKVLKA